MVVAVIFIFFEKECIAMQIKGNEIMELVHSNLVLLICPYLLDNDKIAILDVVYANRT